MACIVSGCEEYADNNIGIRLRREVVDTTAIWAPNTNAMICDQHASQGFRIEITLIPTNTGNIETVVQSTDGQIVRRTTPITHEA